MLKLLRNICIWMCSTSCLFGYVTHAVPMEYFDDHEFSYDMDTAQSEVKYDPRLLSQQLKNQNNHPQERAAPCYSATNKYTHGQRVAREDPCEVCLCVDGEIFCWWKKCGNLKRRKFKLEKNAKLGKAKKANTIERIHKDQQQQQQQQQLHLKQKQKLDYKLKQQQHQHWQEQHNHYQQQQQLQHPAVRNKILSFPENLPSVLYYDYKTEDQHRHQVHHGNHVKLPTSSFVPTPTAAAGGTHTSANAFSVAKSRSSIRDENDGEDNDEADDDASLSGGVGVGVAEPVSSTELKFAAKSHSTVVVAALETSRKNNSLQLQTTARISTIPAPTTTATAATEPFLNAHPKEDQSNVEIQYISGHPAGDVGGHQMLNMVDRRHPTQLVHHNRTTTMASSHHSQEVDHDGILRDGPNDDDSIISHNIYHPSSFNSDGSSIKQNNEQQKGVGATSFRSSFNDFSSEFNASAAMDLALIISSHHNTHNAPIILEADSIANASSSSLPKHELGSPQSTTNTNNNSVLNTTVAPSTTVNPAQECIVMGASYKIGAVLPQDTGNCLQCVCIEGTTTDDTPRVTCSPHNCPPLVLPDLFDATGY